MHKHWMDYSEMHSLEEDCIHTCGFEECKYYTLEGCPNQGDNYEN